MSDSDTNENPSTVQSLNMAQTKEEPEEKKRYPKISPRSFDTVDGRNPAPVDMVNIPLFAGFHTSQVVQDFFHQP